MREEPFPQPRRKDGEEPCGECHIQPGERCDICGAVADAKMGEPNALTALTGGGA